MSLNINNFKAALRFGGLRTNLFRIQLTNPIDSSADILAPVRCKASSLPQKSINPIPLSFNGRQIKVPGVTQNFEDWTVTILEDEDFTFRDTLVNWMNVINSPVENRRELGSSDPNLIKSVATVSSLSQTGNVLKTYEFTGIFPTNIGEVSLDWGNESVAEYTVTFSVDWWDESTAILR